jgi:hypothetical protein
MADISRKSPRKRTTSREQVSRTVVDRARSWYVQQSAGVQIALLMLPFTVSVPDVGYWLLG